VWVDSYAPPPSPATESVVGIGDTLDVRVLGQEQLSARTQVRSDGYVSLPFLNDVEAAGLTSAQLSRVIEELLREYVKLPVVTIAVEKAEPAPVSVLGEVSRPGKYDWAPDMSILDLLALVGGLTEYAHPDRLYVLRGRPDTVRIRFDVRQVMRGEGRGVSFTLEPGDVVVAE
jgi:polysaccharide export outer membrane protein